MCVAMSMPSLNKIRVYGSAVCCHRRRRILELKPIMPIISCTQTIASLCFRRGRHTQQHNTCLRLPILGIKIYIEKRGGLRITGIHIIESVNTRLDDRCKCALACYDFFSIYARFYRTHYVFISHGCRNVHAPNAENWYRNEREPNRASEKDDEDEKKSQQQTIVSL